MAEVDEVKVEVVGVFEQSAAGVGDEARLPLVILRDPADRELHLSLGSCEAFAVHLALARQVVSRPLTHDLALRLLQKLSVTIGRVVIGRHAWDEYQATVYLNAEDGEMALPAQPGDAIAIALRAEAPIYVTEESLSGLGTQSG